MLSVFNIRLLTGSSLPMQVDAVTDHYRLVVAGKELLTSQKEIVNASVGDRFPLYCSVKFYVGSMKVRLNRRRLTTRYTVSSASICNPRSYYYIQGMASSDWDFLHAILAAQYREDASFIPPWLSRDRLSWIDITDTNNPRLIAEATGNLSLHTNDASGSSSPDGSDNSGDLINLGDISTPFFALSKIIDLVVKKEDAGKTLTYRCHYNDANSAIIGACVRSIRALLASTLGETVKYSF